MALSQSYLPILQALTQFTPQVTQMTGAGAAPGVSTPQASSGGIMSGAGQPAAPGQTGAIADAMMAYQNTQNRRFGNTVAGGLEGIYDAIREPKKRKELAEAMKQEELRKASETEKEQYKRYTQVKEAGQYANIPPDQLDAMARAAAMDPDVHQKFMEQLGGNAFKDKTTEATRTRNQRLQWASTPEGQAVLDGMSPDERRVWLATGQQLNKGTTIRNEDIPPDHRAIRDDNGNIVSFKVIAGSPTDMENQAEQVAFNRNWRNTVHSADRVIDVAKMALDDVGITTTGPIGQVLKSIPGTDATNLQRALDTIKANVGFDRLQQMRQASITGGALGNVSNREIELLYNSLAPLGGEGAPLPSPAFLENSLQTVIASYERLREYAMDPEKFDSMSDAEYWDYWGSRGLGETITGETENENTGWTIEEIK
jgi:hypothetical protein